MCEISIIIILIYQKLGLVRPVNEKWRCLHLTKKKQNKAKYLA